MYALIHCKNCGGTNHLSIRLSFTRKVEFCEKCGHSDCPKWDFDFCDRKCLFEWLRKNKIEKNGFPCQDCALHGKPTGFCAGFKENGVCSTCRGKKVVKVSQVVLPKNKILKPGTVGALLEASKKIDKLPKAAKEHIRKALKIAASIRGH